MAKAIASRILHEPTRRIRRAAGSDDAYQYVSALRELFGLDRLDEVLAANAALPAQELADAVLAACRGFGGGDLPDDCAIVVIKRTA